MNGKELMERLDRVELINKIEELTKENSFLKNLLERKVSSSSLSAYEVVSRMVANKVYDEVREDVGSHIKTSLKRKLMDDLKWDLRVRKATDFTQEHITKVEEYIKNYELDKQYTKPVAIPIVGTLCVD